MRIETLKKKWGRGTAAVFLACALVFFPAACGGEASGGAQGDSQGDSDGGSQERAAEGRPSSGSKPEKTVASTGETTVAKEPSDEVAELARAETSPEEIQNMLPADGKRPDPARPLPENPPEGIEVYPSTTNKLTEGPIEYDRSPPTNGEHDPLWQNCGAYEKPLNDRHVVHSLDHGIVWITHQPDLPAAQVEELHGYGEEKNVVVSPYPGQQASVTATSWRVQLELDAADDPRLREFVDGFRNSEIAPLSGNRCEGGVGNPEIKPAA